MNFFHLLHGAEILAQSGNPNVSGLEYDSRRVKPGDAFIAMRGEASDGNKFIDRAIAAGAVAIVTDSAIEKPREGVAWAQVPHGRRALARLSANFYKRPAERMAITGITGTNGKSTTAFLLEAILAAASRKSALIGTIEYHVAGKVLPAPHTTPEALDLNRILAEALGNGATEAVMEVSSHALAQLRVYGIPFDVAVFTNLTRDHLDYHHSMEEYFAAKRILFEGCGTDPPRVAVLDIEDEYGQKLAQISKKRGSEVLTYGLKSGDLHADKIEISPRGTRFDLVSPEEIVPVFSPLIGKVNVYNILAASGAAYARNCKLDAIAEGIASLARVPGRFERVDCKQPFTVIVDYAHTDDALRNLLETTRLLARGRLITVFGCGGDRDRTKRPLMGAVAGRLSDLILITSDNPRNEDPRRIIEEIQRGITADTRRDSRQMLLTIVDRREAISKAIELARPGDLVLVAGKGHEKYQVIGSRVLPFDDVVVVSEALMRRRSNSGVV
jgi:UDP-N-acetylmuramoyl-L-alanyl-D-glutamate--2,6-diaminopimelate ligase